MDPDFPEIPTDYEAGTDFRIMKFTKGQYADYSTSNWVRRERSLNQEERDAINTNGLFNLNDFLPKKPGADELNAIFEMFEASVDGQLYDPDAFGRLPLLWFDVSQRVAPTHPPPTPHPHPRTCIAPASPRGNTPPPRPLAEAAPMPSIP